MKRIILSLALLGLIAGLTSCAKPEEVTISKYFQAMKQDDKDTINSMSMDPKTFKFKSYKVDSIEPPVVSDLALPAMEKEFADLEQKHNEQLKIAQDKNDEAEELKDSASGKGAAEKITAAEATAKAEKEKYLTMSKNLALLKKKIEAEKLVTAASSGREEKTLEAYTGKTEIYRAKVHVVLENGEEKDYIFLLRKNILNPTDGSRQVNGRMVIMKIGTPEDIDKEEVAAPETKPAEPAK